MAKDTCLDVATGNLNDRLILYSCHGGGSNQFFAFAKSGQIITAGQHCVGIKDKTVIKVQCSEDDKSQLWNYNSEVSQSNELTLENCLKLVYITPLQKKWIVHRESGSCMRNNETEIILGTCNQTDTQSQWMLKSNVPKNMLVN